MIDFRIFVGAQAPLDLFRFRYSVYVEEMNRKQRYALHEERMIIDPLDEAGRQLIAYSNNEIVGCIRINCLADGDIGEYFDFYGLSALTAEELEVSCITTRLMVDPRFRRTKLPLDLLTRIYAYGLHWGMRWSFMDCNDHLVEYFGRFGWRNLGVKTHEEYGDVTIMSLDLHDGESLVRRGSPFAAAYRAWRAKTLPIAAE
jgi:GNAT superfamily N-acetyltransferase